MIFRSQKPLIRNINYGESLRDSEHKTGCPKLTIINSVRPIVRTSRTAFVCASDYDDRTQFHMFDQKNEHG